MQIYIDACINSICSYVDRRISTFETLDVINKKVEEANIWAIVKQHLLSCIRKHKTALCLDFCLYLDALYALVQIIHTDQFGLLGWHNSCISYLKLSYEYSFLKNIELSNIKISQTSCDCWWITIAKNISMNYIWSSLAFNHEHVYF